MAPEVMEGKPYDFHVDEYSFGIFLWELTHRQSPYSKYDKNSLALARAVVDRGERPLIQPAVDFVLSVSLFWL